METQQLKMKKYIVTLREDVTENYKQTIKASSEKEAIKIAQESNLWSVDPLWVDPIDDSIEITAKLVEDEN